MFEELYSIFEDEDRDVTAEDLRNMKYTERCIKEALRLYPTSPLIKRECTNNIKIRK